ncbi:MAG: ATP-binding protein [Thermomicrobiales bacterium]|nr:ATP-binding protein [Thermomicrobiales bacterium]
MASPGKDGGLILDLRVPATAEGMDSVHAALAGCWPTLGQPHLAESRWCDEFNLAVAEVAANIIQHAHDPEAPFVSFDLSLTRYPDRLRARFVDPGVVVSTPTDQTMPPVDVPYDDLEERGRGLAIVQMTTDRFEYLRTAQGENVWVIEKTFPV